MEFELYTVPLSPFTRTVELQLEMKGLEFKRTMPTRDFVREGGLGEINPIRKIPVLLVDGEPICEARVILELVEELQPDPALLPKDAMARARVRMLENIALTYITSPGVQLLNLKGDGYGDDVAAASTALLERGFRGLEHWLSADPYALGEMRTIADCALAPALFFLERMLPAFWAGALPEWGEKTRRYFVAISKDADVARAFADMETSLEQRLAQA